MSKTRVVLRIIITTVLLSQVYKETGIFTVAFFMLILLESMLQDVYRKEMRRLLAAIVDATQKNAKHALEILEIFGNVTKK